MRILDKYSARTTEKGMVNEFEEMRDYQVVQADISFEVRITESAVWDVVKCIPTWRLRMIQTLSQALPAW